jgi:deoxycytidylate deaminase
MKPKFIDYYMKIAEVTATLSYAKRLNVGAVTVTSAIFM